MTRHNNSRRLTFHVDSAQPHFRELSNSRREGCCPALSGGILIPARGTGIFESGWNSWTSCSDDSMELHKLAEVVNELREKSSRKDKKKNKSRSRSSSQEVQEEEKEEAQPIRLQLEFLIDNFFGLKLCPVEAGQEQEGGCGSYVEGRRVP